MFSVYARLPIKGFWHDTINEREIIIQHFNTFQYTMRPSGSHGEEPVQSAAVQGCCEPLPGEAIQQQMLQLVTGSTTMG